MLWLLIRYSTATFSGKHVFRDRVALRSNGNNSKTKIKGIVSRETCIN
jgi:hypothetical protein